MSIIAAESHGKPLLLMDCYSIVVELLCWGYCNRKHSSLKVILPFFLSVFFAISQELMQSLIGRVIGVRFFIRHYDYSVNKRNERTAKTVICCLNRNVVLFNNRTV